MCQYKSSVMKAYVMRLSLRLSSFRCCRPRAAYGAPPVLLRPRARLALSAIAGSPTSRLGLHRPPTSCRHPPLAPTPSQAHTPSACSTTASCSDPGAYMSPLVHEHGRHHRLSCLRRLEQYQASAAHAAGGGGGGPRLLLSCTPRGSHGLAAPPLPEGAAPPPRRLARSRLASPTVLGIGGDSGGGDAGGGDASGGAFGGDGDGGAAACG